VFLFRNFPQVHQPVFEIIFQPMVTLSGVRCIIKIPPVANRESVDLKFNFKEATDKESYT
jgi:hypothetical protein